MSNSSASTTAIVLACEASDRMWPLGVSAGKYALPVLNQPAIERLMGQIRKTVPDGSIYVLGVGESWALNDCALDAPNVTYRKRGSSGIADLASILAETQSESALLVRGDLVTTDQTIETFLTGQTPGEASGKVLATLQLPGASQWIALECDNNRLLERAALSRAPISVKFGGAMYCLRTWLLEYLAAVQSEASGATPSEDVFETLLSTIPPGKGRIRVERACDFVVHMDRPWQLVEANTRALSHFFGSLTESHLGPGAKISDQAYVADGATLVLMEGASIGAGCHIEGSLVLGARSRIEQGFIVERDCFIGEDCLLEHYGALGHDSVLGPSTHLGHMSHFRGLTLGRVSIRHPAQLNSVIGQNVNIAGGVLTGNVRLDNKTQRHVVDGTIERPQNFSTMTYIGNDVKISNGVIFQPGTKVGNGARIGPGAIVSGDIPDGTTVLVKQKQLVRVPRTKRQERDR